MRKRLALSALCVCLASFAAAQAAPATAAAPTAPSAPSASFDRPLRGEVRLAGGAFVMGTPADEPEHWGAEAPLRRILLSPFWMMATEVTQRDYAAITGANPSRFPGANLPVERVSWFEAVAYANRLSAGDGLKPAYAIDGTTVAWDRSAAGWRLPTEAEWEYACRAGTATAFSFGLNLTSAQANYNGAYPYAGGAAGENRGCPVPAGSLPPNAWGLYELHGNVWEWCWDWYAAYPPGDAADPAGPAAGVDRAKRGGGWAGAAAYLRSGNRGYDLPDARRADLGFRLVRNASR
jgi:formylglycine-generating enzyme required for sulfatase activity